MQTKAAMSLLAKQQRRQRRVISSYIKTHFPESSAAAELRLRELLPVNKFLNVLCENTPDGLLPVMYNVLGGCRGSEEMEQKLRAAVRTEDIGYADAEFIPQLMRKAREISRHKFPDITDEIFYANAKNILASARE